MTFPTRRPVLLPIWLAAISVFVAGSMICAQSTNSKEHGSPPSAEAIQLQKEALGKFNSLIGGWRGIGMPKRFSRKGAWSEKAEWVWDFKSAPVAIRYDIDDGKLFQSALLTYIPAEKTYKLLATLDDKTKREYTGKLVSDKLVLESKPDDDDHVHRLTVTRLNEKRTIVLHEKRKAEQTIYTRVAEVGYTRQGTRLASSDQTGPECIVTGGAGTMKIDYKGQTYYVCCTGCREAFLDDPEGIIADAKERAAEKKKKSAG